MMSAQLPSIAKVLIEFVCCVDATVHNRVFALFYRNLRSALEASIEHRVAALP